MFACCVTCKVKAETPHVFPPLPSYSRRHGPLPPIFDEIWAAVLLRGWACGMGGMSGKQPARALSVGE